MRQKGKYTLFTLEEFALWLHGNTFFRPVILIQNHHTFIPSYEDFKGDNHLVLCEEMEQGHLERGFAEIAQNLTTFPDGTVAICRSFDKDPAGIKGANQGAICIEHLGNFDLKKDEMTTAQQEAVVRLNALLCKKFHLLPGLETIVYHHWYDRNTGLRTDGSGFTKTCPGTNFFSGNTVAASSNYFIPLITAALSSLDNEAAEKV